MDTRKNIFRWLQYGGLMLASTHLHAATNLPTGPGCPEAHCNSQITGNLQVAPAVAASQYVNPQSPVDPFARPGSGYGLGCSSNLNVAACSYGGASGSINNLEIFDGTAKSLYRSGAAGTNVDPGLNSNANYSAPIVFNDGSVLGADDVHLVYYYPASGSYTATFTTLPGVGGKPVSPVMVSDTVGILAENCGPSYNSSPSYYDTTKLPPCQVITFKIDTSGATPSIKITDAAYLFDINVNTQGGNGFFETLNTPTVNPTGPANKPRVYISASELCISNCGAGLTSRRQGRLWAVDVDPSTGSMSDCLGDPATANKCLSTPCPAVELRSGNGKLCVILNQDIAGVVRNEAIDFPGPSGASPLLVKNSLGQAQIFFDGMNRAATLLSGNCPIPAKPNSVRTQVALIGCFYGVVDNGTAITKLWANQYPNAQFQAAAALDPQGGVWVDPAVIGSAYTCTSTYYNPAGTTTSRNCMVRLNQADGKMIQQVDLTSVFGTAFGQAASCSNTNPVCYCPYVVNIAPATNGFIISTATSPLLRGDLPSYFVTLNITGTGVGVVSQRSHWPIPSVMDSTGTQRYQAAPGQFPVVQYQNADGSFHKSTVFTTTVVTNSALGSGPYFIGDQ